MAFADDYNDVASRQQEFFTAYPTGCLRAAEPFRMVEVDGVTFVAYTAAAYRTPDDPAPGIGSAWERVPGLTNFTKNSELQNAETSAWGRAIVAVGAADTKKGIASFEDVRNRSDEPEHPPATANSRTCTACGGSLVGAAVEKADGGFRHKGGCPAATRPADGGGAVPTPSPSGDDREVAHA